MYYSNLEYTIQWFIYSEENKWFCLIMIYYIEDNMFCLFLYCSKTIIPLFFMLDSKITIGNIYYFIFILHQDHFQIIFLFILLKIYSIGTSCVFFFLNKINQNFLKIVETCNLGIFWFISEKGIQPYYFYITPF